MFFDYEGIRPICRPGSLVFPNASVIGDVVLEEGAAIWFGAILRGDVNYIRVGRFSNVQDGVVVHTSSVQVGGGPSGAHPTLIGDYVTIGHNAVIHACTIESYCLIGMGSVILDGSVIGEGSVIGAGAVITANTVIPPYSVVVGMPGKVVKTLPPESQKKRKDHAQFYYELASKYSDIARPPKDVCPD